MVNNLKSYNSKRDFDKTAEPRGVRAKKRGKKLRFVVQHHLARRDHYDFRLEWDGVLKSWAVPKGPSYDSHDKRLAVEVEDHPLDYRTFEGTIAEGEYGGGVVMLWDEGTWLPEVDVEEGLTSGSLKFTLEGERLKGRWALVRMKPKEGEKKFNWLLIKENDEYVNTSTIAEFTTSVTTGRTMDEIREGKKSKTEEKKKKSIVAAHPEALKKIPAYPASDFTITHPEKIVDKTSGATKGDIAGYYYAVSKRMFPYLENRLLSAVRCPNGITKSCFYKKHPAHESKGISSVSVTGSDGKDDEYYYIADINGLMSEVQMNTVEFHTWGSRAEKLELPDIMVFDLDPDEGLDLDEVRRGVRDVKAILDELSLTSYLKTSGGKGYHVVIPFKPGAGWDNFHAFAQNIAKTMEAKWPDRYTSNVRKNRRNNRIFVDWMRNGRGATSVAPYSVRAREGLPVSMPIAWKELDSIAPGGITMADAIARLRRKDPWDNFFENGQRLK